jgi:ribosomal protein S18 acetylase RimI-like enzyme
MSDYEFRSLGGEDPGIVYRAFMDAFADYAVKVDWSRADFEASNRRRGYDPGLSVGAYREGRLAGFVLSGRGAWRGRRAAYDLGTGVLPQDRGSGLAGAIAAEIRTRLESAGIETWVLEVIRDNAPAFRTYEKAGFAITRSFECPGGSFRDPGGAPAAGYAISPADPGTFPWDEAAAMRGWEPSWQNSDESIARASPKPLILAAREVGEAREVGDARESRLAGYIVAQDSGSIWQLAVSPQARRRGLGTGLLRAAAAASGGKLRYINVQSDDAATLGLLASCGIAESVGQYEMILDLASGDRAGEIA